MHLGWLALGPVLLLLCACAKTGSVPEEPLAADTSASWTQRPRVRAFYSGHSLSDGVPEAVAAIGASLQRDLDYEFQTLAGSLLRERTKGRSADPDDLSGYRSGRNRRGEGLDVAAELRGERAPGRSSAPYDVLVVTERHDLPWAAYHESTAHYLARIVEQLATGNARAEAFLYHTWLELDLAAPEPWMRYERSARRLWECVASRANQELAERGRAARVRVLPGATALVELVEEVLAGRIPGMDQGDTQRRLRWLFRDQVHLAPAGTYFMGLVHYAVLFGQSPQGAAAPADLPPDAVKPMQVLAWQHARAYAQVARPAATRSMDACRAFAAYTMCPAFSALRGARDAGWLVRFSRMRENRACQGHYLDSGDPQNPFH
jgi:hypothetical protein